MTDNEIRQALRDPAKREKAFELLICAGQLCVAPDTLGSRKEEAARLPWATSGRKSASPGTSR